MTYSVAASYSLDTLFTSNQNFPEDKTLLTLLRKTTQIGNASVPKSKSSTKEDKYLSSFQLYILRPLESLCLLIKLGVQSR